MKRRRLENTVSPEDTGPSTKKSKTAPVEDSTQVEPLGDSGEWTKVEKRKTKKAKKVDAKQSVRIHTLSCSFWTRLLYRCRQALPRSIMRRTKYRNERKPLALGFVTNTSTSYTILTRPKDVRDFIMHLVADAPPVGWIRVEVRTVIPLYQSRTRNTARCTVPHPRI